ncbi:phosphatidate cytidylyltransferase [Singulisphaera acidiphila]|uniref:Putative CDP-diglyceride synthetase/phosphatidate cytidylyltransferase n=1 Tax=Singulisphaera acidiphila (strain ATCC BAA-1392 / DSM 18658 / VKM B-2454 / MOB10) TaxID=886293 RepID=L0DQK5_SINAD|nr:phosphatidate cytidylyltransferase [Singulisphaera acidiphila]AGA31205.1 putative CDP-diglyceride synthetase/phosphatidate cytidylyltransferase [Singulisphaera acidiphila DSM 18658]
MSGIAWERLFGWRPAFDERAVVLIVAVLGGVFVLAPLIILALDHAGRLSPALKADLRSRYLSWLIMVPLIVLPVLLGAAPTILAVALLSLLCYREFARATGLFREKIMSVTVVLGIVAVTFAVADHWYAFFVALTPITLTVLTAVATSLDRPAGYIQRVALAVFGFLLFGICLGHLGYMANDTRFRSLILLLLFSVQLNDIFAYIVGKSLGGPKLAPHTSPNKTISGSLGAVVLTTLLVYLLSGLIFTEGPLSGPVQRLVLGLLISISGQFGDLSVSSIKRDVGVKDTGSLIPGHGGVLDRANSLLLSAPTVFHYINYLDSIGIDQATRVLSGGG